MKLTEWMTTKQWTCERLAVELGVSMTTVWKWRSGSRPDYENIHKLRKLTRGRVKDEDWPARGARAERLRTLPRSFAKRLAEANQILGEE